MIQLEDFESNDPIAWCPGCGNFSILKALKQAFVELDKKPSEIVIVSGIGQAPKTPHYLRCNTFNGLHGRTLPVATGIKLANHELTVLAEGGDGDGYAEGGNHFMHAMRRNIDIAYLVHDNQVYGLTKGQTSPTSGLGFVTKTAPTGTISPPLNPLLLAIAANCSFVARGFAGEAEHLSGLIKAAIQHKGFAFIDILQPCVSFNRVNTFQWYSDRIYALDDETDHDAGDIMVAFKRAQEWGKRIPIGIIFRKERPTLDEQQSATAKECLVKQNIDPSLFGNIFESFK
jgi:2-oxoglutarate ferredoxin oxidoreductase subunit beta